MAPTAGTPPQRLGDFEVVRELGRGGMGVVYEARQMSLNRKVALKVLAGGLGLTPKAVERFRREAEAAAKLHHTNIVPVYATGEQDGQHFYAMELVEGPSLDRVLRHLRTQQHETAPVSGPRGSARAASPRGASDDGKKDELPAWVSQTVDFAPPEPTPPPSSDTPTVSSSSLSSGSGYFDAIARMVAAVADALDYAHNQKVIHRDIKPSNLLLSPDGRLSINDFGLARMLEQPGMTMTGEFVGTPAYMSPEQITAGRTPLDHRTDIYSLGATLYEMLTFQPPFRGERRDQVLAQIIHKEVVPPRKLNKQVPVDLETICLKALDKDPDKRYQTAGEFAEDLRNYVNRFAIKARRAGPVERLRKWVKRNPALSLASLAVVVAALVAGFFAYQSYLDRMRLREQQQQTALENAKLAAMSGDLDRAEEELKKAERLGAGTGQGYLVRGLVALYRGDADRATKDLEEAVVQMPNSVAARALLGVAYFHVLDWEKQEKMMRELQELPLSTPEDRVFHAMLIAITDPARGKTLVDEEAFRRDQTGLARAVRAEVLITNALFTGNLKDAEMAVEAAKELSDVLPRNNPLALVNTVHAYLHKAVALAAAGRPDLREAAFKEAAAAADKLKDCPTSPMAWRARYSYHYCRGQLKEAEAVCDEARKKVGGHQFDVFLANLRYHRGDKQKALSALEHTTAGGAFVNIIRGYILTDLGEHDTVNRLFRESDKKSQSSMDTLYYYTLADFSGRQKAFKGLDRDQILDWQQGWYKHVLAYCRGEIDEKQLLDTEKVKSKAAKCEAHFFIAMRLLGQGKREEAKKQFEASVATGIFVYHDYQWSRAFLARMDQDESWPSWIKPKR